MPSDLLNVLDVHKSYGAIHAVRGVSFQVVPGEVFGLLGPNGAGKTTLMHLMVGVLLPDCGSIRIGPDGDPTVAATRRQLGLVPQQLALYEELTAEENVRFAGRLYGLGGSRLAERTEAVLEFTGLLARRRDRAKTYSGGMKRRLNLACGLVHDPDLVFLDEPTAGVDPQSRNHLFERVEALREAGKGIVYTTHYMEEAQRLCDRVAIMDAGRILDLGSVADLIGRHGSATRVVAELASVPPDVTLPGSRDGEQWEFFARDPFDELIALWKQGVRWRSLAMRQPDLESVFLQLTGKRLRDGGVSDMQDELDDGAVPAP